MPFLNSCFFTNSVSNPSMSETETHKERISCLSANSWSERSGQKRTCFHENENVTRCQSQEQLRALNSVVDILLTTRAYTNPVRSRSNQINKTVTLATLLLRGCFVLIGFSLCLIVKDRQRMCQAKQPKVICLPKLQRSKFSSPCLGGILPRCATCMCSETTSRLPRKFLKRVHTYRLIAPKQ